MQGPAWVDFRRTQTFDGKNQCWGMVGSHLRWCYKAAAPRIMTVTAQSDREGHYCPETTHSSPIAGILIPNSIGGILIQSNKQTDICFTRPAKTSWNTSVRPSAVLVNLVTALTW